MTGGDQINYKLWRAHTRDPWGFKITTIDNKTYITAVFDDTPAKKAGVGLNEVMLTINRVPCDNMSHDYVSHVISKVDHDMVLVTRKPTNAEAHYVAEITRDVPITVDGHSPSSKHNVKNKQKSKPTENKGDSGYKNEEKYVESFSSNSKRKDKAPSVVVASESYLSKRRHLVEDIELDNDDEVKNIKLKHCEETHKVNSRTLPSDGVKKEIRDAAHKDNKGHERKSKTLDYKEVNGGEREIKREKERPQSFGRGDGDYNHREEKRRKNRESRVMDSNKDGRTDKPAKGSEESRSPHKEPITERVSSVKVDKTDKSEPRREKKEALAKHKSVAIADSDKKTHHLTKSKSSAELNSKGRNKTNHLDEDDSAAVKEMKKSFPSMVEIRSNLQAGKRRTLLLNNGDTFEKRVAMLNDL
ncbi:hypothetical protein Aperf_G00000104617 [Anoplocephala perfoliata]